MPRRKEILGNGERPSDLVALGVLGQVFPRGRLEEIVAKHGKKEARKRLLPSVFVVYFIVACYLYMGVSQVEVIRILLEAALYALDGFKRIVATKGAITQARDRLESGVMKEIYEDFVKPLATRETPGAWYRGLRVMAVDGSTLDIADTQENWDVFGGPSSGGGQCAYPQFRFVALCETGTRSIVGVAPGRYNSSEKVLAYDLLPHLGPEMVVAFDRFFYSYLFLKMAMATGAHVLMRVVKNINLPVKVVLADGSYLAKVKPSPEARREHGLSPDESITVRVIQYDLKDEKGNPERVRLITDLLDCQTYPSRELVELYENRWESESAFAEIKTHLKGSRHLLRSKSPELIKQDFYGLLLAHFVVRRVLYEAAMGAKIKPNQLSFSHALNVVRRRVVTMPILAFSPSKAE